MWTEERKNRVRQKLLAEEDAFDQHKDRTWHTELSMKKAYLQNSKIAFHELMRGTAVAFALDELRVLIDEDDLLAGRLPLHHETEAEKEERERVFAICGDRDTRMPGTVPAATNHRAIDYEKLLKKGINGVLDEVRERRRGVLFTDPDGAEKKLFYDACILELEAVIRFQERYHAEAVRLWTMEADPERKQELERMMNALARVPAEPAQTFYEAMQSMWLIQFVLACIEDITVTGRPDDYLYPYYQRDIQSGILTDAEAFSLIEDLYFRHNHLYGRWPAAIMVGGRNRQGQPNWNELSRMFIQAIETTGLINPSVAVAYNDAMPEELLELSLAMVMKGYTRPSFFNDDVIIRGLKEAGVSEEDANYYIHSTCVEITPIAASNIQVATPYINLNKALEYLLNGGEKMFGNEAKLYEPVSAKLEDLDSFEKFYAAIKSVIESILKGTLEEIQYRTLKRKRYYASPLSSCFLNDCLALGKDSGAGGARYNYIYPCFPGFINLIDSLCAIRQVVYEEKMVTLSELADALKGNFDGEERLRAYLLNKCPKFGNDLDECDEIGLELFLFIKEALEEFGTCVPNGGFYPSYFAYFHHAKHGGLSAATPDGRGQGEALSECLGAVQGMDKNGPLALVNSISKIPQHYGIGGIATNIRFGKHLMQEGFEQIKVFVKEFMRKGNFELQFNVVDHKTLLEAQAHPQQYQTLMVRVAGFSDYFVNVPLNVQNEIIKRMEHNSL